MAMDIQEEKLKFLHRQWEEARDEIKMRIQARNSFGIQLIVTLGALLVAGFTKTDFSPYAFFLMPLVVWFFSSQISYSYAIHELLHRYLVNNIEKGISEVLEYNSAKESKTIPLETYFDTEKNKTKQKSNGIRKEFFNRLLIAIVPLTELIFGAVTYKNWHGLSFWLPIAISSTIYIVLIILFFKKELRFRLANLNIDYMNKSSLKYAKEHGHKSKALFLDRDGTIHEDMDMTHKVKDLKLYNDVSSLIRKANECKFLVIVITNQEGIGKGVYSTKTMHKFNETMRKKLSKNKAKIDAIYFCPHTESVYCDCRKPEPGMLNKAISDFNINAEESYFIGDAKSDIEAALAVKLKSLYITTGRQGEDEKNVTKAFCEEKKVPVITKLSEAEEKIFS